MAKELWEIARGPGQPPKFNTPQEMWELAVKYFEWCGEKVILEDKVFSFQGEQTHDFITHKRPMTQKGLCVHLGIGVSTWHNYKNNDEFLEVTDAIEDIMFENKFSGAAVGMFNANIIARDLGLTDKQEITMDNANITPWSDIGDSDE